jgi:hypothetical protein
MLFFALAAVLVVAAAEDAQAPPSVDRFPGATAVPDAPEFLLTRGGAGGVDWGEAFARRRPFVVRNASFVARWRALQHWSNPAYVAEKWGGKLKVHVTRRDTVQMLSFVQPFGRLPEIRWRRRWHERWVESEEFFTPPAADENTYCNTNASATPATSASEWMYLYTPIEDLPVALRRDLGNLQSDLGAIFRPLKEAAFWSGPPGISSPLHYDAAHNAYLQVSGRKRFLLFPHNVSDALYSYPRLHPSTRQSMINVRNVLSGKREGNSDYAAAFPQFFKRVNNATLAPMEVLLSPGDVLYIPPYYWHRASVPCLQDDATDGTSPATCSPTSSPPSMSIAAYTPSDAMSMYQLFKGHPVPISPDWTHDQQVAGLREYVCGLSHLFVEEENMPQHDCSRWVRSLLAQRFDPLFVDSHDASLTLSSSSTSAYDYAIAGGWSDMMSKQRRFFVWLTRPLAMPPAVGKQLRAHAGRLQSDVERIQRRDGDLEMAVVETEKMSVVEDVVNLVLGTRFVEPFLRMMAGELVLWSP